MIELDELLLYSDELLDISKIQDYCPNGLQVAGREQIRTLVSGVTASRAFLDAALAAGADALLVHHGYFWKGEDPRVVGIKKQRLQRLLQADVSLIAYHLPLDMHPVYGNNAQLGKLLGIEQIQVSPQEPLLFTGTLPAPIAGDAFAVHIEHALGRAPLHVAGTQQSVQRLAWCSGGAQKYIERAVELEVDAYLTGEVSESTVHIARECGLHFYAAGHHATERYGVQALGAHLAERFDIAHRFIDIFNPA